MKSQTKNFDTVFNGRLFEVEYELYASGRKQLMYITYDHYRLDIAQLFGSDIPHQQELYAHIMNAMNNNAMGEREVKAPPINDDLFNMVADITRLHAKVTYGINR